MKSREFEIDFPDASRRSLEAALKKAVRGEVRFDAGSRALYATDASNYRQVPIGVVIPKDTEDVVETVKACREHGAPILSRGGGTSLCGQCCNVAVVIDMSKYMNAIIDLDSERRIARVQPGVVLDDLRTAAERFHLTFAPDPSTHNHNTLGGMIGNNSCGPHSLMGGKTVDNVIELDVLTYEGERMNVGETSDADYERAIDGGGKRAEIYRSLRALRDRYADEIRSRFPDVPRRVSGYNLDQLLTENGFHIARALVGTESTCVTVLEATVKLVPSPQHRVLLVLGYPDIFLAGDDINDALEHSPIALEGIDDRLIEDMKRINLHPEYLALLPEGKGFLLVEFGGETADEAEARAHDLCGALRRRQSAPSMKLYTDAGQQHSIWTIRRSGLGATAHVPGKKITWEGWEDSAVPPAKVGAYLRDLRKLLDKFSYECDLYGHFGQGCIHTRIDFDLETREGIENFRAFLREAADLVVSYGGSISGEHGDGQSKAELLPKMFGDKLIEAFREFKRIWDPQWKMNPGKVVDAYRADENLRLGTNYAPPAPVTHFSYEGDRDNFARAMLRCVGVGECRRKSGGTMCPSYRATMEEKHSTRGRARMLFEMLQGDVVKGGWRDEHVKESLDLCLACKGCRGDCPVSVDMATYKAEFHSHYYKGRLRPRSYYAFGLIDRWARIASKAPRLVNFMTQSTAFASVAKSIAGVAHERRIPAFANQTFSDWFAARETTYHGGTSVILWPDTFNNYFHPETLCAALNVLEDANCDVRIPRRTLCCGRALFDPGMLDRAKAYLKAILEALRAEIRAGISVVALEPACVAVFRDELTNLYPFDQDAMRLSRQSFTLGEFLRKLGYEPRKVSGKALLHGHCHQKAIMGMSAETNLLGKAGLDCTVLDSGCCGMAGSFGFEREKYEISMKIGEQVLLPAVRSAAADTLIIADGFSCREQIAQCTNRRALHIAEVLNKGIKNENETTQRHRRKNLGAHP
jgi:FAD/FMN-containing dehydrogenase/Fe-S oxidoreductase